MIKLVIYMKNYVKSPIVVLTKRGGLALTGVDRIEYDKHIILKTDKNVSFINDNTKPKVNYDNMNHYEPCYYNDIIEEMGKNGGL